MTIYQLLTFRRANIVIIQKIAMQFLRFIRFFSAILGARINRFEVFTETIQCKVEERVQEIEIKCNLFDRFK